MPQPECPTGPLPRTLILTRWPKLLDADPKEPKECSWPALVKALRKEAERLYPEDSRPCMIFGPVQGARKKAGIKALHVIGFDHDHKDGEQARPMALAVAWLERHGLAGIVHETTHSAPEGPRWRLLIPLAAPWTDRKRWEEVYPVVAQRIAEDLGVTFDPACSNVNRVWFPPSLPAKGGDARSVEWVDGLALDLAAMAPPPAQKAATKPPGPKATPSRSERTTAYGRKALDTECANVAGAGEGSRNATLNRAAFAVGQLVAGGEVDEADAVAELREAASRAGIGEGKEGHKTAKTIARGLADGGRDPRRAPPRPPAIDESAPPPSDADAPLDVSEYVINGPPPREWPELRPLRDHDPVPRLTRDMIPWPLRAWIVDCADRASLPLEMIAVPAMVALGAVVGRQVAIRPEPKDDWTKVPNLWGCVVAPPAVLKSAALAEGLRPLSGLAAKTADNWAAGDIDRRLAVDLAKAVYDGLKRQKFPDEMEMRAALEKLASATSATERRYLTDDVTVEKLGELLRDNPRGVLLRCDELARWLKSFDRPGREGDRQFYLEAWTGTGGYVVDRIGRGTIRIPALCLSVIGTIQPATIASYVSQALDAQAADGLLQRLQLLVWPDGLGDYKAPNAWPDRDAKEEAGAVFERLDSLDWRGLGAEQDFDGGIPYLRFAARAQPQWREWRDALEARLRGGSLSKSPAFQSHLGKYRSLLPSLALLWHLASWAAGGPGGPVTTDAFDAALSWVTYLEAHARKLYDSELCPGRSPARVLAERIRAGDVSDGDRVRDIAKRGWTGLGSSSDVAAAAAELERIGWVAIERESTGGRAATALRVNPQARS